MAAWAMRLGRICIGGSCLTPSLTFSLLPLCPPPKKRDRKAISSLEAGQNLQFMQPEACCIRSSLVYVRTTCRLQYIEHRCITLDWGLRAEFTPHTMHLFSLVMLSPRGGLS